MSAVAKSALPTRLMVINGDKASLYVGGVQAGVWGTGDQAQAFDRDSLDELSPMVFDADWSALAQADGRRFPLLEQPGDERVAGG